MALRRSTPSFDVLLVGPYPPPFGGVSVHIQRLTALLKARGVSVGVLDHFGRGRHGPPVVAALKRNPLRYMIALPRFSASVMHYHHGGRLAPLLATALMLRRRTRYERTIITVHGHDLQPFLESRLPFIPGVTRWSLARFDVMIAVSEEVADTLREHLPDIEVAVLPAYLPPPANDTPQESMDSPTVTPPLVVSAYDVLPLPDGDLYGLDLALDVFQRLADDFPSLPLLILLSQTPRRRRGRRHLRARLNALGARTQERITVMIGQDLANTLHSAAVYLRPTRLDGDAVSVREALALGIPVVASDIVQRPLGTTVVNGYEVAVWADAVAGALRQQAALAGGRTPRISIPSAAELEMSLLKLYARPTAM